MTIEHLHPESRGGLTIESNLWLACRRCNEYKAAQTHAPHSLTGKRVRLYNPRTQDWAEHFIWNESGDELIGVTPTGRATIVALRLNNVEIRFARRLWVAAGWWPPET